MEVTTFRKEYLSAAARLFAQNYQSLRSVVPVLPGRMEVEQTVQKTLTKLFENCPGVMALEGDRLVGYMGWFMVEHFRRTDRKAAYVPEWGHAAAEPGKQEIYQEMYRAASTVWAAAGCQVHAVTLLANDPAAEKAWFWNGFGLIVVDAIRPVTSLGLPLSSDLCIRKAVQADAPMLALLDAEHCSHYTRPPIFMARPEAWTAEQVSTLLSKPQNSFWMALDGETPVGFIVFDCEDFDGVEIVLSDATVAITGAYVRPQYRGIKAAARMLEAALRDYAALGMERCVLNFESFNPEAAKFWLKYFEPVCLSVMRVPEA